MAGSCQTAGNHSHRFSPSRSARSARDWYGLVEVEEIYLAITDRQLRAADRGASSTLPRSWPFKRAEIPEPCGF